VLIKENEPLFLNLISSLFFIYFLWFKVLWVCQIKISTLIIWALKVNEHHRRTMEKTNVLNFKMSIRLMVKHWPHLLLTIIFSSFCVCFEQSKWLWVCQVKVLKIFCIWEQFFFPSNLLPYFLCKKNLSYQ
jgi:hypothetical protein